MVSREVDTDKICWKCGEESVIAFMNPDGPLYYACNTCGMFSDEPEKIDQIYNKEMIIAYFHIRYLEGKTEEEKRELLDNVLSNKVSYLFSEGSIKGIGVIVFEPVVIPFYQSYTTESWVSNYYGLSYMKSSTSMRWVKPIKYSLLKEDEVETISDIVGKFEEGTELSEGQSRARRVLEENQKKSIKELLELIYEGTCESLTVWGYRHDTCFNRSVIPTYNGSYQLIFTYPDLEILDIGRCW